MINPITYIALLVASFTWFFSPSSTKTINSPEPPVGCKSHYDSSLQLTVYTGMDKEPEYPGGGAAWGRYVHRNLNEQNLDDKVDCNVRLKMVVDSTGAIRKVTVMRGDVEAKEPNTNEKEVMRVYQKSGRWMPGTCGGKEVSASFILSSNPCNRN